MSIATPTPSDPVRSATERVAIPDPEFRPTIPLWPEAARVLGLGRSAIYEAANRGELPTLKFGRRIVVPTAALRKLLGLDQ